MDLSNMTAAEIIAELEQRMAADEQTMTPEEVNENAERMSALTAELESRNQQAEQRNARIEAARTAIESGSATRLDTITPAQRSAQQFQGSFRDTTDYAGMQRSAYFKDLAQRSGLVIPGMEMSAAERTAFTHLTSNTGSVVPTETQNQIISLIDNSAVMFADAHRDTFEHVYEVPVHKAITAGDAASTDEGAAPANDEQDTFGTIALSGVEIKKTVKMSRKMQIQSIDAFETYIVTNTAARLAHAAELLIPGKLTDNTTGMPSANKIAVSASTGLAMGDFQNAFGKLKTFNNPAPKGCIVYANGNTIWNHIAGVTDEVKRPLFIQSTVDSDPTIQGRVFGKTVKQDDALADGVIFVGYPDLFFTNIFGGIDITPYVEPGSQKRCWDGYLLWDGVLAVPASWAKITIS